MGEPWHVLGAGAMGCLYADALQRGGSETALVMRRGSTRTHVPLIVERNGLRSELDMRIVTPDDPELISRLLVTTKAYDVREAVAGIIHRLTKDSVVLLLINGMGLAELLRADWPHLQIYCGTSTEGAYRVAAQHIRHVGRGETRIGRQGQQQPAPWFEAWARAVDRCYWDRDIESALWSKLAVNCIINPLTAVHGCCNGELARRGDLAAHVVALCAEVAAISHAAGFADIAAALPQTVAAVIAGTADNRSSMLQDVTEGRRTEIDYITGYLLKVAERFGIDAPHNRTLLETIKNRAH
ncbi:MAG TPA: 2-dehydropantoate 2-reductase [Halioglobus sp.]